MKVYCRNLTKIALLCLAMAVSACGKISGSIGGHIPGKPGFILNKAGGSEIVSSSQQDITTTGGYKVQSSAGNTLDKLEATTSGNYKVQMTVQGVLLE